MTQSELLSDAIALLKDLIATPSISREEDAAAQVFENQLKTYGLKYERKGNNIWCLSPKWEEGKPTLLLNAHIDTVKPVASWTRNPFDKLISRKQSHKRFPLDGEISLIVANTNAHGGIIAWNIALFDMAT